MAENHSIYLQTMIGIIGAGLPAPVRAAIVEAGRNAPADSYEHRVSDAVGQTLSQYLSAAEQRQRLLLPEAFLRELRRVDLPGHNDGCVPARCRELGHGGAIPS